ncbi:MAG: HigA family addiction module antitoxin [Firmicutes bacterium]|nr:HigA family addiction module antitoxin [Bacillota bacterium]
MSKDRLNQYQPETVTPPGDTLLETIEALGISQAELAQRMERPVKTINEIIKGKAMITPDTALQLERVLGIPASFWQNREQNYREYLARREEGKRLQEQVEWLSQIPVATLIKLGWVKSSKDKVEQLKAVLDFFGVASPEAWRNLWTSPQAVFRKSTAFQADPGAVASWLRKGELVAQTIPCKPFEETKFKEALKTVRQITRQKPEDFIPEVVRICADAGVAVVFVPELPRSRVSGATRWLNPSKALIQLSFRYNSDDQLWFTFFHEASHILRHGKRRVFLEGDGMDEKLEQEADRFARDLLIPPRAYNGLLEQVKDCPFP